jgi:hypothetical protein
LGVFNITKLEPDYIEMKNDHAINLTHIPYLSLSP